MKRILSHLLPFLPLTAWAWDPAGHMLVGQVAWENTKPAAREKVNALVQQLDTRFNEMQPYNFVTAGCWMDDMRSLGSAYLWAKLHYVTIPWTESGAPAPIPEAPHIVAGIDDSLAALRNPQAAFERRVEALGMLMHFLGDIHQPLHTTDRNGDRGGNGFLISGVAFSDLQTKRGHNLHTFWDKAFRFTAVDGKIVEQWTAPEIHERPKAPGEGVIALQAAKIMAMYPRENFPELATRASGAAMAVESHVLGCKSAYPPGEPPSNSEVRPLTAEFVQASHPIANRRVALAGYRLAALLNELFP